MESLTVFGCVALVALVALVAIFCRVGFKGTGPGGTSMEVKPPEEK